ncbi:hypothetical protein Ancab_027412 [Ancistrocladus abbreviatus]
MGADGGASLTLSQSSHAGSEAAKPLSPHSSLLTQHLSLSANPLTPAAKRRSPSVLTPHAASLTLSQSSHAGSEAAKPLSPHSATHTVGRSLSQSSPRRRSLSVLSPHSQPVISHAGDKAPQSSILTQPHAIGRSESQSLVLAVRSFSPRRSHSQSSFSGLQSLQTQ